MSKVILSNRIYLRPESTEHTKSLMKALTYRIEGRLNPRTKTKPVEIIKNYKVLPNGVLSLPQGRMDLIPDDWEVIDKRVFHEVPFPLMKFPLRESQQPVYDEVNDSCLINALVGWGKTATALHIARKLGQKTLVITHTTALRDQWIEEVEKFYGHFPGVIGSGKYNTEDQFIVVGNVQTLTKFTDRFAKEFGTVILDECHHCPATSFSNILDTSYARYRIGLSGTLNRTDGKHILFKDYFGSKIHKPPQSDTLNPVVKLVNTGIHLTPGVPWVNKMNNLLYDEDYQQFVTKIAKAHIDIGHSVLIIADRVEFLNNVKENIGETCVLITGETGFDERKAKLEEVNSGKKMCIAGSRQIFSEGISVNRLSCVILAVPTSNPIILEQIIGRIMRLHPEKLDPVVIDLQFSSFSEKKQNSNRLAFYASKGWKVIRIS